MWFKSNNAVNTVHFLTLMQGSFHFVRPSFISANQFLTSKMAVATDSHFIKITKHHRFDKNVKKVLLKIKITYILDVLRVN